MGWTCYDRSVANPKAECDSLLTWSNPGESYCVLASAIVGGAYYAAVERRSLDAPPELFAAVFLIQTGGGFGYKDMTENMGPNEDRCPVAVLEHLTPLPPIPAVTEWRDCPTCKGSGKMAPPNTAFDCWACHAEGQEPVDSEQRDRWASARDWRKRAWAHHGGEPQGRQIELAI